MEKDNFFFAQLMTKSLGKIHDVSALNMISYIHGIAQFIESFPGSLKYKLWVTL